MRRNCDRLLSLLVELALLPSTWRVTYEHAAPWAPDYPLILRDEFSALQSCHRTFSNKERDTVSSRFCAMLRMQASDEEVDDVFPGAPLYCGRVGSDVIVCRFIHMVFLFVCSRHGSRWQHSPLATPRGRIYLFTITENVCQNVLQ